MYWEVLVMCETIDFDTKVQIIKTADLEDAEILTENYTQLILDAVDSDVKDTYIILRTTARQRIKELAN